ncbi:hypothetical protein HK101_010667 [Irineochytrium annulatum]|nr:hypothetical protein HK101_010667 [Irineochytrium annulatum]
MQPGRVLIQRLQSGFDVSREEDDVPVQRWPAAPALQGLDISGPSFARNSTATSGTKLTDDMEKEVALKQKSVDVLGDEDGGEDGVPDAARDADEVADENEEGAEAEDGKKGMDGYTLERKDCAYPHNIGLRATPSEEMAERFSTDVWVRFRSVWEDQSSLGAEPVATCVQCNKVFKNSDNGDGACRFHIQN